MLLEPTYHGNLSYDVWLLMRLIFATLARTWWWVPILFVVGSEAYLRHEQKIKHFVVYASDLGARVARVPTLHLSPKLVRVEKAKARKAVA